MSVYRAEVREGDLIEGKYRVSKKIGTGSYGDVFKVEDAQGKCYALKLQRFWEVSSELHDILQKRFEQEYATACIKSPYLVHAYEYGTLKGNPYLVMEYCPGGDLSRLIGQPSANLPRIAHDVLQGLHALHTEGKVHRDLKPENVLLKTGGLAALTDFGVVGDKSKRLSSMKLFGRPKELFGTYIYMSPEMTARKRGGVTYLPTNDIFSFGVMMYELLTGGSYPFGTLDSMDDLTPYQQRAAKGLWDRDTLRTAPRGEDWMPIIEMCLWPDYTRRYQSTSVILQDLSAKFDLAAAALRRPSRTHRITHVVVSQGANVGATYRLVDLLKGGKRQLRCGRERDNDIVLQEQMEAYTSRYHFTLEYRPTEGFWFIRDGQWRPSERCWVPSTNGTYVDSTAIDAAGQRLYTGDIITVGEVKLKVE